MEAYLRQMSKTSPDRHVRANALLYFWKQSQDEALRTELLAHYGDLEDVQLVLRGADSARERLTSGASLSNTTLRNLVGHELKLHRVSGFTLLTFSTSWCSACRDLIPELATIHSKFRDEELRLITLHVGMQDEEVRTYLDRLPEQPWHHVPLPEEKSLIERYDLQHYPRMFLLSPDGQIIATDKELRRGNLERMVGLVVRGPEAAAATD